MGSISRKARKDRQVKRSNLFPAWAAWPLRTWRAWREKILCFRPLRSLANLRESRKFSSIVVQRSQSFC